MKCNINTFTVYQIIKKYITISHSSNKITKKSHLSVTYVAFLCCFQACHGHQSVNGKPFPCSKIASGVRCECHH